VYVLFFLRMHGRLLAWSQDSLTSTVLFAIYGNVWEPRQGGEGVVPVLLLPQLGLSFEQEQVYQSWRVFAPVLV